MVRQHSGIDVLDEIVESPSLEHFEKHRFRYTGYVINPSGVVTSERNDVAAPFQPVTREAIERFIAGEAWAEWGQGDCRTTDDCDSPLQIGKHLPAKRSTHTDNLPQRWHWARPAISTSKPSRKTPSAHPHSWPRSLMSSAPQ